VNSVEYVKKYQNPPIDEVVCGLRFGSIPGLDAVTVGFYAKERREDFPRHEVQPPIGGAGFIIGSGAMPIRIWLVSANDEFVVQVQHDRFFVNWRARGGAYPKFSGDAGILPKFKAECERFWTFCERELGHRPELAGIELAKIDQIPEGVYWNGLSDLGKLVPWLADLPKFSHSERPLIGMRFVEPRDNGKLSVVFDLGTLTDGKGQTLRTLKLESRIERAVEGGIDTALEAFKLANDEINEVFDVVIPEQERSKRFNG